MFLGRQAIFDRELRVHAYELLYRDSSENRASITEANHAAVSAVVTALVDLGLDAVAPGKRVFVNVTGDFLTSRLPIALDPVRVVLEVLETVPPTTAVLEALRAYRQEGFTIALDDFVIGDERDALLEVADVVKLDVLDLQAVRPRLPADLARIRDAGALALAERIERSEDFTELRGLGFAYFQGYFLERPVVLEGRRMPTSSQGALRLLASLCDPRADVRAIERALAGDASLTFRLLRLASSAAIARSGAIASVGDAIHRLGTARVAALAVLMLAAGFTSSPPALLEVAAIRGHMGEVLAGRLGLRGDHLLLAGLLSVFDALLGKPIDEVLAGMALPPEVQRALIEPGSREHTALAAIRDCERGDARALGELGVSPGDASDAWIDAVAWSEVTMGVLSRSA